MSKMVVTETSNPRIKSLPQGGRTKVPASNKGKASTELGQTAHPCSAREAVGRFSSPVSGPPPLFEVNMHVAFSCDLDEGRYAAVSCLACRCERATIGIAAPFRFYVAALDCDDCGEQLCEWDVMTEEAA